MCKSKAEGGARCKYHLQQAVNNCLVAYSADVTGLKHGDVKIVLAELAAEGVRLPDPTREEVDRFLESQIFRVRHEQHLSEPRKASIIERLRAAIGRITPDGATFHAWRNTLAESWSRVRRKAAAAFLVSSLAFGVGACGNVPNDPPEPNDTAAPVGAPVQPGSQYDTSWDVAKPKCDQDVLDYYGQDEVDAAYAVVTDLIESDSARTDMLQRDGSHTMADFGRPKQFMSTSMQKDWDQAVSAQLGDDDAPDDAVQLIMFHDLGDSPKDLLYKPTTINPTIAKASVKIDNNTMMITAKTHVDVRSKFEGAEGTFRLTKTVNYWMVKEGGQWKVDGISGEFQPQGWVAAAA